MTINLQVPKENTILDTNFGIVQEQGSVALEGLLTLHISLFSLLISQKLIGFLLHFSNLNDNMNVD